VDALLKLTHRRTISFLYLQKFITGITTNP